MLDYCENLVRIRRQRLYNKKITNYKDKTQIKIFFEKKTQFVEN